MAEPFGILSCMSVDAQGRVEAFAGMDRVTRHGQPLADLRVPALAHVL